jgi:hypothetical protein
MADIFISYSREDRTHVEPIADAVRAMGYSVWWDKDLPGGARYLAATEAELEGAKAVLVIWSKKSVVSHWVADEAGAGRDSGRLIPVSLDGAVAPLGFRQFQVIDFSQWKPGDAAGLGALRAALERLVMPSQGAAAATHARKTVPARTLMLGAAGLAVAAIGGALVLSGGKGQAAISDRAAFFGFTSRGDGATAAIAATANDETVTTLTAMHLPTFAPDETVGQSPGDRLARAKALGARYAVSGDVQADGDGIAISVRLEDVPSSTLLWSEVLKGKDDEPLGVQAAALVTDTLGCFIERVEGLSDRVVELGALIALACRDLRRPSLDTVPAARELALKAPDSAIIHGTLGLTILLTLNAAPEAARPALIAEAEAAMLRGLELDPGEAYSHLSKYQLGVARGQPLAMREQALLAGLKARPADATLNNFYGNFLRGVGLNDKAFPYVSLGIASDPLSTPKRTGYALGLALSGRKADAEEQLAAASRLAKLNPALWQFRMRAAVYGGVGDVAVLLDHPPAGTASETVQCWRDIVAGLASRNAAARTRTSKRAKACVDAGAVPPESVIGALSMLGDVDAALAMAETPVLGMRSYAEHFVPHNAVMRADPRFLALMESNGAMAYWKSTGTVPDFCKTEEAPVCRALGAGAQP